jgi:S-adenosylmethionine:tRNA ribosyltransferase-isomerase
VSEITPFQYVLPEGRIAQRPLTPATCAKLLVVERAAQKLTDAVFKELPEFINEKHLFVFNNTRVIPARFFGKLKGSEREVEILLLRELADSTWSCIGRPMKYLLPGTSLTIDGTLHAIVREKTKNGELRVNFFSDKEALLEHGTMPIPPYIRNGHGDEQDKADYQTFFAEKDGSIAAPTASLHFNAELLDGLKAAGAKLEYLTLHVGSASFRQVTHSPPGEEEVEISSALLDRLREHKKNGGTVLAVGTTVVRALESAVSGGLVRSGDRSYANLFIRPGYPFRLVDQLITNFHQPGTTHMLLVEALLGRGLLAESYQHAIDNNYRFLSYGDGMLIL